jgi:hypothetical protein
MWTLISRNAGPSDLEEKFKRELERRSIGSIDDLGEDKASTSFSAGGVDASQRRATTPPPRFASKGDDEVPPQLRKSRELNSEGLEGLIPRASELLKLGVSFFLAFGPFILGVVLAFGLIYSVFGDAFVHSGSPSVSSPPVYDPQELLNEPTVDPMIPM